MPESPGVDTNESRGLLSRRFLVTRVAPLVAGAVAASGAVTGIALDMLGKLTTPEINADDYTIEVVEDEKYDVVGVGDSLGEGICFQHTDEALDPNSPIPHENIGWVDDLARTLRAKNVQAGVDVVDGLARNTATSASVLLDVQNTMNEGKLHKLTNPIFCLSVGGNDILHFLERIGSNNLTGTNIVTDAQTVYEEFRSNFSSILELLLSSNPTSQIISLEIPDLTDLPILKERINNGWDAGVVRDYITMFNNAIDQIIVSTYNKYHRNIAKVNMQGFIQGDNICTDGIHPSPLGYWEIAKRAMEKIRITRRRAA
jgi:lysophospholipase L1-like esterase